MIRVPCRLVVALLAFAAAGACGAPPATHHLFRGDTMGTTFSVTIVVDALNDASLEQVDTRIRRTLDGVEVKMSTYIVDSELSRFNRTTSPDPFPVSMETIDVLRQAREVSELTGGAFDVTVAPLVGAWGFGPFPADSILPSDADLSRLRLAVGYEKLQIDIARSTISKTYPGLQIDVSAIAKGYGVDRVAEVLNDAGIEAYLIEVGGEVRTRGRNSEERLWRVGIERPSSDAPGLQRVIELEDAALATSGDYRNFIEYDGRRISHTIDPRSGRPVAHGLASVSVIDSQCAWADAVATALEVMGPDEAFALASNRKWAAFLIIRQDDGTYRELATPAFEVLAGVAAL